ncbi:MAG TPA: ankyrin repeat domain-containing protein, partial [Candidatus Aminicenantes bacterium]|nr:ankyrin repeat domain-containing protein [Candidatus Aminicenantes bacterium]
MKKGWIHVLWIFSFLALTLGAAVQQVTNSGGAADGEAILELVRSGDLPALQTLAEKDPAVCAFQDRQGRSLLHGAVAYGHLEMARWLIDRGSPLNAVTVEGTTPLMQAALAGRIELAHLLIARGANLEAKNNYGRTALVLVGRERGDVEMARLLLDAEADINASDRWSATAIGLAAWRGFGGLVDFLLDRGAALPEGGEQRLQLFSFSLAKGLDKLFDRLMAAGVDPTRADELGGNVLHAAADGGSEHILAKLLERKLDVNLRDRNGWTPLHRACERGRTRAAALLL